MNSRQNIAVGLSQLAELGFNTIYPVVWQRGYTLYPSKVAQDLSGSMILPNSPFVGRDVLAEIIELAAPLQLQVIPWLEYGLMVPPQSSIALQHPDLLMSDIHGSTQRIQGANGQQDPNVWLNPTHDRVCKFMVDLISDLVSRYAVTGIQLDDHFSFPVELGYDQQTQILFRQQVQQQVHFNWHEWRSAKLTELLTKIVGSVRSIRPDCMISIAPNPLSFSQSRYLVDWQEWCDLGLVDELVLQVYRDRLTSFEQELRKSEVQAMKVKIPTLIGILTGLRTKPISTEAIAAQVKMVAAQKFGGFSCFFNETMLHEQLSPILMPRDRSTLIDIFR
jgi:uncharacterized lipoprotein YddW (UPF0748 family)